MSKTGIGVVDRAVAHIATGKDAGVDSNLDDSHSIVHMGMKRPAVVGKKSHVSEHLRHITTSDSGGMT